MLGAIEFAGLARERLRIAGAFEPEFLIKVQSVRDVLGGASLQENGKRKAVFDRLTSTLADVRNHGVCRIPHERDAASRPVGQRSAIIDAPAKRFF